MKQTEVDYEVLKWCCENRWLQKELQEVRALKAVPLQCMIGHDNYYMPLPANMLSMCASLGSASTVEEVTHASNLTSIVTGITIFFILSQL